MFNLKLPALLTETEMQDLPLHMETDTALRNLRSLLVPGGRLLIREVTPGESTVHKLEGNSKLMYNTTDCFFADYALVSDGIPSPPQLDSSFFATDDRWYY